MVLLLTLNNKFGCKVETPPCCVYPAEGDEGMWRHSGAVRSRPINISSIHVCTRTYMRNFYVS